MEIGFRPAHMEDLPLILPIYAQAREYMRRNGNPHQWDDNTPSQQLLIQDIQDGHLYLCMEDDQIAAVFYYKEGPDPTYLEIYEGQWLDDGPYGVIHRIAVAVQGKGIASHCFAYALSRCPNLKIDTHRDNLPMQRALSKNGFTRCGIIHLGNGDERIAYQKSLRPSPLEP